MDKDKLEFEIQVMKVEIALIQQRIEREIYLLANLGFHTFCLKVGEADSCIYLVCYDAADNRQEYQYPGNFKI